MKILLIEDEYHAVKRLSSLIKQLRPQAEIVETIDSVEDAVEWFGVHPHPDLAFFDIQLADGLSFDIFTKVQLTTPVIFTTAFNEYALKAFKVNSIDYLLKPIEEEELEQSFQKFEQLHQPKTTYDTNAIEQLVAALAQKEYTERFLVKTGQHLTQVRTDQIAYFYSESSLTFIRTNNNQKHLLDYTLDQLDKMLNPKQFFRINRKTIVQIDSIQRVSTYFNSRLVLQLSTKSEADLIVSRERVKAFKQWLGA